MEKYFPSKQVRIWKYIIKKKQFLMNNKKNYKIKKNEKNKID